MSPVHKDAGDATSTRRLLEDLQRAEAACREILALIDDNYAPSPFIAQRIRAAARKGLGE
jgi:hypothetical protein